MADKIEIIEDPEIDRMYRLLCKGVDSPDARSTSRVEITLIDGRVLSSGLAAWGDIQWDDASLEKKFRWLTGYVLDDERIDRPVRMVWEFDDVSSVRELTRLLQ